MNEYSTVPNMKSNHVLIYGANGYSGRLAARHAHEFGVHAILAGRSRDKVKAVADETGLPFRVFDIDPCHEIDKHLADVSVLLNCAGPFSRTADVLVQACLRTSTHYIDITGEIDVIERLSRIDETAKSAGTVVMPATGFDVVPTDCVALHLSKLLPDATHLELAFTGGAGLSHGTATTMIESLGEPSKERQNGEIVDVPVAVREREINFGSGPRHCVSIPWGDVASAYVTTGIPNIVTYTAVPKKNARVMKASRYFGWLLGSKPVQSLLKKRLDRDLYGPSDVDRDAARSYVYGEVRNAAGQRRAALLTVPGGYTLTYMTSLKIAALLASGEHPPGFHTPAGLFGEDFVLQFPHAERVDVDV